jgi:hypothetical protein
MFASFRGMTDFVFEPPLRLVREVTVRTLDDAAEFARTYVGPRLPYRRDRVVRRLEEASGEASARGAARAFRAWAIAEGLLAKEKGVMRTPAGDGRTIASSSLTSVGSMSQRRPAQRTVE